MKTFCLKMMLLLILASLLLISTAQKEVAESLEDQDEMIECFMRLACIHDKLEEFVKIAEEAGQRNYNQYVYSFKKCLEMAKVDIPGDDLQFWIQLAERGCEISREEQKEFFLEVSRTNSEYLMEICMDSESEPCVQGQMALDKFGSVVSKYKANGLCPLSETADKMESPIEPPLG